MSTKERMEALISGKNIDRIPIMAMGRAYSAALAKTPLEKFYMNPKLAYEVQYWAINLHNQDGKPSFGIPGWSVLDFGGELIFPSNIYSEPFPKETLVKCPEDIERLEMPDVKNAPSIKKFCEFAKISLENGGGVGFKAGSPLEIAGSLLGIETMLRWMVKEPHSLHKLLRISTDYLKSIAKYYVKEFGSRKCSAFIPLPLESNTLISERMFRKYSLRYLQEIVDNLTSLGIKRFHIHLCGDHSKNLKYWLSDIKVPPRTIFSLGKEMDIFAVSDMLGEKYIIAGNISTSLLCTASPKKIYEETKELVIRMKNRAGGFILMPECGLSPNTPPVNLHAMIKAGKDFG